MGRIFYWGVLPVRIFVLSCTQSGFLALVACVPVFDMNKLSVSSLSLILFVLLAATAPARQPADPSDFVYRHWDNQNGLPQNTVYDLLEDSLGYLWGATEEGLFRFDGSRFEIWDESNTPGLGSNIFYTIKRRGGQVWAAGRHAVLRIGSKVEKLYDFSNLVQGGWIKSLEMAADGRIWVATSNGLLYRINGDSISLFRSEGRLPFSSVEAMRQIPAGLLLGTVQGLFLLAEGSNRFSALSAAAGLPITGISRPVGNRVWIGTTNSGVREIDVVNDKFISIQGLQENFVNAVHLDSQERLWIGFRSSGYQILQDGKLIRPRQGFPMHDGVRSFCSSGDKRVWLGTTSSGLFLLRQALIGQLPDSMALAGPVTLAIYQEPGGITWVSSAGRGVNRISGKSVKTLTTADGLSNNLVLSVGSRGQFTYIGTTSGLDRFNSITGRIDRHFTVADGLRNNGITVIFRDSRNRLWVTTRLGGVQYLNEEENFVPVELPSDASSANMLGILEDREGSIWLGSRGAGAIRISPDGKVSHYDNKTGFPASVVYSFLQDQEGDIWMSSEKGLILARNDSFRVFGKESGLLFNEGYCLLQDDANNIWMSGNLGLQRLSWATLKSAKSSAGKKLRMAVHLFNEFDGMPNSEANGGFYPAGWRLQNGTLWFPTVGGVAIADYRRVNAMQDSLGVMVQGLRYADLSFFPGTAIRLPAGVNNFEIRYTSIQFAKAADIRYRYRLRGFSNEWTEAGNRQIAFFSTLPPGQYSFEVEAELYGEFSPIAVLEFSIAPYFYQTIWFKILAISLLLLATAGIVYLVRRKEQRRLRHQQLITRAQMEGQERERQLISAELHDSINQQLSTAKIYLDFAKAHPNDREELIGRSSDVIYRAIQEIRSLCYSISPVGLRDMGLREAIEDLCRSYSSVGKFKTDFQFRLDDSNLPENMQFVMFRIVQEQMNNIARHAHASSVSIELKENERAYFILIRDNGRGFDPGEVKEGLGFANMRNRLSVYKGRIEVSTAPDAGCLLQVSIPKR